MKRLLILFAFILLCASASYGQGTTSQNARRVFSGAGAPTLNCNPGPVWTDFYWRTGNDTLYVCTAAPNTWTVYGSGGGGGGAWGAITGTLSDQTDLQTALDLKAPKASPTFTGTVVIPTPFTLGAVSVLPTGTELNFVDGVTSNIQTQLNTKAPLASPTFTGVPAAPTAAVDTDSTQIATTAYIVGQGYAKLVAPVFSTTVTSPVYISGAADPADAGAIRLGNAELIEWESSPAGTDVSLTVNSSEQFVFSNQLLAPSATRLDVSGTGGAGFIDFTAQSSAPTLATNPRLFSDSRGLLTIRNSTADSFGIGRLASFSLAGLSADRDYSLPDASGVLVLDTAPQTLSNKTLTSPVLGGTPSTSSLAVTGTAGAGFESFVAQSSNPSAPASGFKLFAGSAHAFSWIGQNGFTRTFDGTANTANRVYTLPDADGTITALGNSSTGSGNVVLATSPTITGATITTPTLIQLTNPASLPGTIVEGAITGRTDGTLHYAYDTDSWAQVMTRNVATWQLGASGTLGSLAFGNATSGTVTINPVTGALGTVTLLLPAANGTLATISNAQTFTGVQSMTSPDITTSITTPSTTFALLNATATTVNAFGAATTVNTGASATQIWNFGGSTTASEFRFLEPSGSGTNYSAFKSVAMAGNITYSLPPTAVAGGVWTDVAGNGVLTSVVPSGSGASASLDNLASVSINTALLAQTGVDLGSTTKPFRDLFLFGGGTYGTNYFRLTGTPTGLRVVTLPDSASYTLAQITNAQSFTGLQTFTANTLNTINGASVVEVLTLRNSSVSSAAGLRQSFSLRQNYGGTSQADAAYIDVVRDADWVSSATEDSNMRFYTRLDGATAEKVRITSGGNLTLATGNVTFTASGAGILGTATNDAATAGNVGESVVSTVAVGSAVSLTTATAANVTSISLTAGDWDVRGNCNFTDSAATVTATQCGLSSTSATLPTDGTEAYSGIQLVTANATDSVTMRSKRFSLSGTTTIYLVGQQTFSIGTASAFGSMGARRIR